MIRIVKIGPGDPAEVALAVDAALTEMFTGVVLAPGVTEDDDVEHRVAEVTKALDVLLESGLIAGPVELVIEWHAAREDEAPPWIRLLIANRPADEVTAAPEV